MTRSQNVSFAHNLQPPQLQVMEDVCAVVTHKLEQDVQRCVREAVEVMEDYGPPVSACRGRHQTTVKWP